MDKRFFLALFLSLIAIAVSQLLFPPPKPVPSNQRNPGTGDSSAAKVSSSSTDNAISPLPSGIQTPASAVARTSPVGGKPTNGVRAAAETTVVSTAKAIYKFSSLGGAPVSVVVREYKNRSPAGGLVEFVTPGSPLLGYRLITAIDTVDLSQAPFTLARTRSSTGDETLTYNGSAGSHTVSISYAISQDTSASYLVRVNGRIAGVQSPAYLISELPKTLQPTEADTAGDHRTLAYSFKPQRDHARSVLFGSLDP